MKYVDLSMTRHPGNCPLNTKDVAFRRFRLLPQSLLLVSVLLAAGCAPASKAEPQKEQDFRGEILALKDRLKKVEVDMLRVQMNTNIDRQLAQIPEGCERLIADWPLTQSEIQQFLDDSQRIRRTGGAWPDPNAGPDFILESQAKRQVAILNVGCRSNLVFNQNAK